MMATATTTMIMMIVMMMMPYDDHDDNNERLNVRFVTVCQLRRERSPPRKITCNSLFGLCRANRQLLSLTELKAHLFLANPPTEDINC